MKIRFLMCLLSLFFIMNCSDSELVRTALPLEKSNIEIIQGRAGLIRTLYCDVVVENITKDNWAHISGFSEFKGEGKGFPVEPCFLITVYNTWKKPLQVESVSLRSGGRSISPEYYRGIADSSFAGKRYSVNLLNLWKARRILSRARLEEEIDYESDSVEYKLDFIAPGDRVSRFYLFSHYTGAGDNFVISLVIKYLNMKKVIDFDLTRPEHRDRRDHVDEYEY